MADETLRGETIEEERVALDDAEVEELSRAAVEEMGLDRWPVDKGGNMYAEIELPDPEVHGLKSALIIELNELIRSRRVVRDDAARALGFEGVEFEKALRGEHFHVPLETIVRALAAMGYRVRPRVFTISPNEITD